MKKSTSESDLSVASTDTTDGPNYRNYRVRKSSLIG